MGGGGGNHSFQDGLTLFAVTATCCYYDRQAESGSEEGAVVAWLIRRR